MGESVSLSHDGTVLAGRIGLPTYTLGDGQVRWSVGWIGKWCVARDEGRRINAHLHAYRHPSMGIVR